MYTTLAEISSFKPCKRGYRILTEYLGPDYGINNPIHILTIMESNGINDAAWALRTCDYKDYAPLLLALIECVPLDIINNELPESKEPEQAVQALRDYINGDCKYSQLREHYIHLTYLQKSNYCTIPVQAFRAVECIRSCFTPCSAHSAHLAFSHAATIHKNKQLEDLFNEKLQPRTN